MPVNYDINDEIDNLDERLDNIENNPGGGASYLVYTALLTQSGTDAPVATVLENTLGGVPVWSYVGGGNYIGTLTGVFTSGKTWCMLQNMAWEDGYQCYLRRVDDDTIQIYIPGGDSILETSKPANIEIRVYP